VQFHVNKCIVGGVNDNVIVIARCQGNLYQMTCTEVCKANVANFVRSCAGVSPAKLWHHRLGHLDVRSIYALESMIRGMNLNNHQNPWKLCIRVFVASRGTCHCKGQSIFVIFIDDFLRNMWVT
jgi:hypothetical protein